MHFCFILCDFVCSLKFIEQCLIRRPSFRGHPLRIPNLSRWGALRAGEAGNMAQQRDAAQYLAGSRLPAAAPAARARRGLPQASHPRGSFSDTSTGSFLRLTFSPPSLPVPPLDPHHPFSSPSLLSLCVLPSLLLSRTFIHTIETFTYTSDYSTMSLLRRHLSVDTSSMADLEAARASLSEVILQHRTDNINNHISFCGEEGQGRLKSLASLQY